MLIHADEADDKACDTLSRNSTTASSYLDDQDMFGCDALPVSRASSEETNSEVGTRSISRVVGNSQQRAIGKLERQVRQFRMSLATVEEIAHDRGIDEPLTLRVVRALECAELAVLDSKDERWSQSESVDAAHEAVQFARKVLYEVWAELGEA